MDPIVRRGGSSWSVVRRILLLTATWSALTAGDLDGWVIGVATVGVAVGASYAVLPPMGLNLAALPRLIVFLLVESIRSGVQVALLALSPRRSPAPAILELELGLEGGSRTAFAALLSVMPGTLAVEVDGSRLTLHVLDARMSVEPLVRRAEALLHRLVGGS